jgi:hypothetical protein
MIAESSHEERSLEYSIRNTLRTAALGILRSNGRDANATLIQRNIHKLLNDPIRLIQFITEPSNRISLLTN